MYRSPSSLQRLARIRLRLDVPSTAFGLLGHGTTSLARFKPLLGTQARQFPCSARSFNIAVRDLQRDKFLSANFRPPGGSAHGLLSRRFSQSPSICSPIQNKTSDSEAGKSEGTASSSTKTAVPETPSQGGTLRENIYTIPNVLTVTRIAACPVLAWSLVTEQFHLAAGLVVYAGLTDLIDGYLARRFDMKSVLGTILDPAADKALMTTLVVALAWNGMLPVPLAALVLGRDVALSISAFYYRYISLPPPKTFARYWDFSIPSAEVRPTGISKVNTALQLLLMTATVFNPILPVELDTGLEALQWIVAVTTVWSGASYIWSKDAVRILTQKPPSPPRL